MRSLIPSNEVVDTMKKDQSNLQETIMNGVNIDISSPRNKRLADKRTVFLHDLDEASL